MKATLQVLVFFVVAIGFYFGGRADERRSKPAPFPAETKYVDLVNGNDSNVGTAAFPWKTMAKAGAWVEDQQATVGNSLARVTVEPW